MIKHFKTNIKFLLFSLLAFSSFLGLAQLSDLHYLPPMKQGQNNAGIREQAIYLSTPETTMFTVNVYIGTNTTLWKSYNINNTNPALIDAGEGLTDGDNNITLVSNDNTGIVLTNSGLRFESAGSKFYVNYRGQSASQAASLTSKGREAMGTSFRWGGVPNLGGESSKSNTLGIMATENNTTVTLSGYDPDCTFRLGANADGITADTFTVTLDANESFVFENYVGTRNFPSHIDGWIGASVIADKKIVISNGAMNFGRVANSGNRDAGIDQPVPTINLGKEYVFVRGNGNVDGATEFPLIIATANDTDIYVQGSATPIATIDNGEYYQIPSTFYSGTTAGDNMFVVTSKDAYAYQCLAGSTGNQTAGLNFIAPVNCLLPDLLNNIPDISNMAGTTVSGGLTIIASTRTLDSNIQVFEDGIAISDARKGVSSPVAGSSEWKTFYIPNLNGDISATSTGPMAVGFVGFNGDQGVAGYFSGFDTAPEVILDINGGVVGECFAGSSIFIATENFDAYQWYYEGEIIPGATSPDYAATEAGEYYVQGYKGECPYDSDPIIVFFCDPDIQIIKSVEDAEITEGKSTTFTIRVENLFFEPITNLRLTDNIPAGLTLISGNTTKGSWTNPVWNIGTLNPGEIVFLELEVSGDELDSLQSVALTNSVSHTQDQVDTNITEDILSATVIVHNDFDKDGVRDNVDLDDDNDGIYDTDECTEFFCFENIINESFEEPVLSSNFQIMNESLVPGWFTTATDSNIELWRSGFQGVDSYNGNQHAELNATRNGALYQNLCLTPGSVMSWTLRHRGRAGEDTMQLRIGADLASATIQETMVTGNVAWQLYSGTYTVPAGQNNTVFIFEAVKTASSISVGNFIDDIRISVAVPGACIDTDGDGYPDNIDLDSDNDGCSDADEWYKDNNADADDGGEYGSGTPVVDPNLGTVIAAPYTKVLAPEIPLTNTPENAGVSIEGQQVARGDIFDYVLNFQNIGDDAATGYTIRNVLPANVTYVSSNLSGLPIGVTPNAADNSVTFTIPDNLVEVGRPAYTLRITVQIDDRCSVFVDACSNNLENIAYTTYQGVSNGRIYSDEPGSTNLPVCSPAIPVATNSVDLSECDEPEVAQLCNGTETLTAGNGFTTYKWAIDTNGNGQIDASETELTDGDGDPRTLVVTSIGNYIVEKSGATGCPDAVQYFTVELFGSTQTNPIVDFFNQVNSDANPDNDIAGEIGTDCNDGVTEFADIFLCGVSDSALLQMNITDAGGGLFWEKLDESSTCSIESDSGCLTRDLACTWDQVDTGSDFLVDNPGRYRLSVLYAGGCSSRFYFNVFQNTLPFVVQTPTDILCDTDGNIRITGVPSGYGYQLINADTNITVIPFSAGNGSSFDIATGGNYKVQIAALTPGTNTTIDGTCIFETEQISVLEKDFEVRLSKEDADCSGFGEISVQALNVFPEYNYRIFISGTTAQLPSSLGSTDNTHTFTGVPPGNYTIVTSTDDGCMDSQDITINQISDVNLNAVISDQLTCNAGLISLSPSGGVPDPNYRMAIWMEKGTVLYTDEADALANATFQSINDFLFLDAADAGQYQFIVFDSNDCSDLSNVVTLENLGPVTIAASNTTITCADATTATLTINANGGTSPYEYSLDDGKTYQTVNTFTNLGAGIYNITVRDFGGSIATLRCTETLEYTITEPFKINASAAIVEDIACNATGTLVKILNATGGSAPYTYSFDGGTSFSTTSERSLSAGNYVLVVKDNMECTFEMDITVPKSVADPSLSKTVDYDCNGDATVTVTSSNTVDFNYTYSLNADPIQKDNFFTGVPVGTQTVTVNYSSALTPSQSNFLLETFGSGPNTAISEIGPGYCYQPQDGTAAACNVGPAGILINGEYSVTATVTNPVPAWRTPNDFNGLMDGRFFAIAVSTTPGLNNILWQRTDLEVLADQDINFSLQAYNLLRAGETGDDPRLLIELVDASGNLIDSFTSADIPKNDNANSWYAVTGTFNPGTNTSVGIIIRTDLNSNSGNYLVLDDIQASQLPEVCERTQTLNVVVEDNKAFEAALLGVTEPTCANGTNGAFRFEVSNFDATAGYEYTINDGTTTFGPFASTNLIELSAANYAAGTYTIIVYKQDDTACTVNFPVTLAAPTPLVPDLQLETAFTCFNTGATLLASATGGTVAYQYQLETTAGALVAAYQSDGRFTNVPAGDYLVKVLDANNCEELLPLANVVTVADPADVTFDATPTACYTGASNGSILVNVTAGNGNYEFRIDGGPWITSSPSTATSHSFNGLSEGSYDIEVRDKLGCPSTSNLQTVIISPQLIVDLNITPLSSCNDGSITINATGGNGTLEYAFVPADDNPAGLYGSTNTFTVTAAMAAANTAGYDVYVQDNSGGTTPLCSFLSEDIIFTPVSTLSVTARPSNPECFDGLGFIDIAVGGGTAPYTYTLVDMTSTDGIDYGNSNSNIFSTNLTFNGIGVGNYQVTITDAAGCTLNSSTATINNAIEITADILPILPSNCSSTIESDYGFEFDNINSPTGTVEYSNDGGTTWQTSPELRGTVANPTFSGTEVFPSIRVEVAPTVFCQKDFPRYLIPFPLDDLDITLSAVIVGCNDLRVTVEGSEGDNTSGYDYTYTDDPANFNAFITNPNVWVENVPDGTSHTFQNINSTTPQYPEVPLLVPGRTYVFYVRDGSGCIRQSNVNLNDIPGIGLPIDITSDITPTCDVAANGAITFELNPSTAYPSMRWEIYELGNATPIEVSGGGATAMNVAYTNAISTTVGLAEGEYYIDIVQVDNTNTDACRGASENAYVTELAPLIATAVPTRNISCNLPGLISINRISGGGGAPYTYDITGPAGFTALTGTTNNPIEIPVNSPAGDYTVTLYDQYSCSLVLNTVALSVSLNPTLNSTTQDNCAAPITVNASGNSAAGNLRYAIVTAGSSAPTSFVDNAGEFTNVASGTYDIYVIDGNGCTAVETDFVVNPVLSASATLAKLLDCTASPDATISIEILNGSNNYQYSITGPGTDVSQINVPSTNFDYQASAAGDYTITIYDTSTPSSADCDRVLVINVPQKVEPIIDPNIITTNVSCFNADDGSITIATTNGAAAPYTFEIISQDGTPTSILPATVPTGNTATFTNLAPATTGYVIQITGDTATNNCAVTSVAIPIMEPSTITVPVPTVVGFACGTGNSSSNASITVNDVTPFVQGGSGSYVRYEFIEEDDPNTLAVETAVTVQNGMSTTYIETDNAGGVFTINVYDDKGCVGSQTATIAPYDELQPLSTTDVFVVNAIECTVSDPDPTSTETIRITNVTGTVTDFASNPTNYEFRELPATAYQAPGNNEFSGLGIGTHTFGVRNISTGCEIFVDHVVSDPNTFDVTVNKLSDVLCFGDNGSITLTMSDSAYTGTFSYEIFNTQNTTTTGDDVSVSSQTGVTLGTTAPIALPTGDYIVSVIQEGAPTCPQERGFNITTQPEIMSTTSGVAEVGCANDQGAILVEVTGGVAPYTITIDNGSGPITETGLPSAHLFQGLGFGTYTVSITDSNSCPITGSDVTLEAQVPIAGNLIVDEELECAGDNDAQIYFQMTATITATPVNYNYVLNRYDDIAGTTLLRTTAIQKSASFDNLGSGFYSITVTDDINSCPFTTTIIEIEEPTDVNSLLVINRQIDCATGTADILLTASGGTAPYSWSTTLGGTSNMMTGTTQTFTVGIGTYTYYVTDSFNCSSIVSNEVTIDSIEPLTLDLANSAPTLNCSGQATALIIAEADGAFGDYEYSLATDSSFSSASTLATNTNGIFDNLASNIYYVRVISGDCSEVATITVIDPDPVVVEEPIISPITCAGEDNGSITVNASGGTGIFFYSISLANSQDLQRLGDENTFNELEPGDYIVFVQDSNGCFELVEVTITEPNALEVTSSSTPEICVGEEDGTIDLTIIGGTAPYSTRLESETDFVQDRLNFTNLAAGDYIIFIEDAQGCEETIIVTIDPGVDLGATVEPVYGCNGTIPSNYVNIILNDPSIENDVLFGLDTVDPLEMQLTPIFRDLTPGTHYISISHANGCLTTYDVEILAFDPLEITVEESNINQITATVVGGRENYTFYFEDENRGSENVFYITETGTYAITVVDENGCEATASLFIEFIDIEIPNFFTPNGDGQNDFWMPDNIEVYPEIFISIYDRYGRSVYTFKDNEDGWDGFYQENELPTGDYWYVIKLNGAADTREFVGNFTLYR
ncbi:T9SS type B sorting domain-containing protein [Maribacter sp. IgM3_T14_3]|uniref:T9SS type B sorting domain-containing protein n=1 Tax=Maribacter sp. IgM3_T14_3 TaxID=3415140 RepID=UPI003C6EBA75